MRRPDPRSIVAGLRGLAGMLLVAVLGGCCTGSRSTAPAAPPTLSDAMALEILRQESLLRSLERFESAGVAILEFPRTPERRGQREQLDLLWLWERPDRTALRLKLSVTDTLAWLGSADGRWWLFLPAETPPVAYRGSIAGDGEVPGPLAEFPAAMQAPPLLMLLAGIDPPPQPIESLEWDPVRGAWRAIPEGRTPEGVVVRRWFEGARGHLVAVEVVAPQGGLALRSALADPIAIEVPGRAMGDWPLVARQIDLTAIEGDGRSGAAAAPGALRLRLDRPSGVGRRVRPALFEWERLLQAMPVREIVEVGEPAEPDRWGESEP